MQDSCTFRWSALYRLHLIYTCNFCQRIPFIIFVKHCFSNIVTSCDFMGNWNFGQIKLWCNVYLPQAWIHKVIIHRIGKPSEENLVKMLHYFSCSCVTTLQQCAQIANRGTYKHNCTPYPCEASRERWRCALLLFFPCRSRTRERLLLLLLILLATSFLHTRFTRIRRAIASLRYHNLQSEHTAMQVCKVPPHDCWKRKAENEQLITEHL